VIKNLKIVFLSTLIFSGISISQVTSTVIQEKEPGLNLKVGEDFTYVVKYAFLNLGEVRIQIIGEESINGKRQLNTTAYIDSYDGLPFVNLHQIYKSTIDQTYFPVHFLGLMLDEDTTYTEYIFYNDLRTSIKNGNYNTKELWVDSTTTLTERHQDGLSILFYARMNFGEEKSEAIPCFVNEKQEITNINFYTEEEPVRIDSVDYEIACRKLEGETNFISVYGLTGEFEGWFSSDNSSVPIIARMNVLIGSVTLELIDWNENLWNPPQYIE